MLDVTLQNFETEVVAASMTTPILIDFWAPWCGPCKSLGPVLEQLEEAYQGRFRLVKINSDEEQQLAQAFGIRSIPTCILMMGGKPVDGFMGALPAAQLREFLDKHLPGEHELAAEADADEAQALLQAGDAQAALAKLADALAADPGNDDARFDYVRLLIELGAFEEAQATLAPKLAEVPRKLRFEALQHWQNALLLVVEGGFDETTLAVLAQRIAANRRDFEARYAKACLQIAQGDWPGAMDELLEIIMRDKKWNDELPRKTVVALLELLTPAKPKPAAQTPGKTAGGIEVLGQGTVQEDPQAALVSSYRRRLAMTLN